jgi:hypothetical protein
LKTLYVKEDIGARSGNRVNDKQRLQVPAYAAPKSGKAAAKAVEALVSRPAANTAAVAAKGAGKKSKTVEEIYQKKTQLEHILLRPDSYSTLVPR